MVYSWYGDLEKYDELFKKYERDLKETWAREMKIESSRQTWNERTNKRTDEHTNERTKVSLSWAPDGAKNWSEFLCLHISMYVYKETEYLSKYFKTDDDEDPLKIWSRIMKIDCSGWLDDEFVKHS